jgi:hypothetical protein
MGQSGDGAPASAPPSEGIGVVAPPPPLAPPSGGESMVAPAPPPSADIADAPAPPLAASGVGVAPPVPAAPTAPPPPAEVLGGPAELSPPQASSAVNVPSVIRRREALISS